MEKRITLYMIMIITLMTMSGCEGTEKAITSSTSSSSFKDYYSQAFIESLESQDVIPAWREHLWNITEAHKTYVSLSTKEEGELYSLLRKIEKDDGECLRILVATKFLFSKSAQYRSQGKTLEEAYTIFVRGAPQSFRERVAPIIIAVYSQKWGWEKAQLIILKNGFFAAEDAEILLQFKKEFM